MRQLEKLTVSFNQLLTWVAGCTLVAMMLLSVVNMILRVVYVPFGATAEVVGWLSAVTIAFALGYTQINRGHVAIGILVDRLSGRVQSVVNSVGSLISMILFVIVAWKMFFYAVRLRDIGVLSESLSMAFYPIVFAIALAFIGLTLVLLVDFIKSFIGVAKK